MQKQPEILAPVGSEDALLAAVRCGADAVYFGAGACNARRNAGQFTGAALQNAVRYCHARNVKVYVTVNTLVRDEELSLCADTIREAAESGADAIIVQDLAAARLARQICPTLRLHASTQMAIHNVAGAQMLRALGFCRVVLARELSGAEIAAIARATDLEIEVFVHGALCMSASGMCYLSAMLGERSGNRGLCAQPCRLDFRCNGASFALSLKDMSHLAHLKTLADAGVASFKIEGRMKRPEYVAAAVDAAVRARDGAPYDVGALQAVFSRSGFTDGYFTGKRTHAMFGVRSQEDADRAKSVLSQMRGLYRAERACVPVTMAVRFCADAPVTLSVSDGTHTVEVFGDVPVRANTTPCTEASLSAAFQKTGGTPYRVTAVACTVDEGLMLPMSSQNALRRSALLQLDAKRQQMLSRPTFAPIETDAGAPRHATHTALRLRFETAAQWFDAPEAERLILPANELLQHPACINEKTMAEVPALVYPDDEAAMKATLAALKSLGVRDAIAENLGAVQRITESGLCAHGGYGLNVVNRVALAAYAELGLSSMTVSFELSMPKLRDLISTIPLGCIVYGRLPLMQLRACPARTDAGCGKCDGSPVVTDRTGRTFPLVCHARRCTTLHNAVPLALADKSLPPVDFYTLYFSTESPSACRARLDDVLAHAPCTYEHTTGLAFRNLQ